MKHLLILMTLAVLTGCVSGDSSGNCANNECVSSDELMDVVIAVFYNSGLGDTYRIVAMTPDGSKKKVLYNAGLNGIMDPVIGCDGRTVLFSDMGTGGIYSLYVPTVRLSLLYSGDDGGCCAMFSNAIFAPDMKEIFFLKENANLAVLTLSSRLVTLLAYNNAISPPSITANGKHLVFAGDFTRFSEEELGEETEYMGIFTMDPDQRNLKMVKDLGLKYGSIHFDEGISVIPATSEIIYAIHVTAEEDQGLFRVYKTGIDGVGETLLFEVADQITNLSSNRRGDQILYGCGCYENTINIAHMQGSTMTRVTTIDLGIESAVHSARFTVINKALFNTLPDLVIPPPTPPIPN